nr:RDD family protein [uncultured Flavobacterium sp.]
MENLNKRQYIVDEYAAASIGQRFLNYLIDTIMQLILMFALAIISFIIGDLLGTKKPVEFVSKLDQNRIALYTVTYTITLLYYNVFEILTARTIGKFITGTTVVNEYGEKPSHENILIRSLCRLIPFNPLSVLIFGGRGWHDSISKTYVVDNKALEQEKREFYKSTTTPNEE